MVVGDGGGSAVVLLLGVLMFVLEMVVALVVVVVMVVMMVMLMMAMMIYGEIDGIFSHWLILLLLIVPSTIYSPWSHKVWVSAARLLTVRCPLTGYSPYFKRRPLFWECKNYHTLISRVFSCSLSPKMCV